MKLICIFLITSIMHVSAASQAQVVNMNKDNVTIKEVFNVIQQQTGYSFVISSELLEEAGKISVHFKNTELMEALEKCFANQPFDYVINKKTIIVNRKKSPLAYYDPPVVIEVSGVITDNKGEPVAEVNVTIKNSGKGALTDAKGNFKLTADNNDAILVFSHVRYVSQEVKIGTKRFFSIQLADALSGLDSVVVIGYGSVRRGDLTGSVSGIKAKDIAQSQSNTLLGAMQGRIAGVNISSQSGEPGSAIDITIRGSNSIVGNSSPLFVIDGIQIDINNDEVASSTVGVGRMDPLATINPSDIASIEVLKDASATAIYGSRGANGVVIITTKSGSGTGAAIDYNGSVGVAEPSKRIDLMDALEYLDYQKQRKNVQFLNADLDKDGVYETPRDFSKTRSHDWQKEVLRTAMVHDHYISVSGGSGRSNYTASIGALNQQGLVVNNDYKKYNFRVKADHQQSDRLRLGFNLTGSQSESSGTATSGGGASVNGVIQYILISNPWEVPDVGDIDLVSEKYISPMRMINGTEKSTTLTRVLGNTYIDFSITKHLKINTTFGIDRSLSKMKEFYDSNTSIGFTPNGQAGLNQVTSDSYNSTTQLTFDKVFSTSHRLNAMAAFELSHYNYESWRNTISNFEDQSTGINDISKGSIFSNYETERWMTNRLSYLSRFNYAYKDKVLATASIRADGSDKFGSRNRWAYFPSFAIAYRISKEAFMKNISRVVNDLKVRLSYGKTGNERIPAYSQYATLSNAYYAADGVLTFGMAPSSRSNPDLKWETTSQYNAGLDVGLFDGRINFTFDYYDKTTDNMLLNALIPSQSGYNSQWMNIGKMENSGYEFSLSTINIKTKDFQWETNFNISFNTNKIISLGKDVKFLPVNYAGALISDAGRTITGEPVGTMYGYTWDGVYQISDFTWQNNSDPSIAHASRTYTLKSGVPRTIFDTPLPGKLKFKDLNGDGLVNADFDRQVIGKSAADHWGGITNTFRYKKFDLTAFLQWSYGNDIFNDGKLRVTGAYPFYNIVRSLYKGHWSETNSTNEMPAIESDKSISRFSSTYYIEDGSFLRVKNVTLGYELPKSLTRRAAMKSVRLFVSVNNLYTFTNYSGYDPEVSFTNPLLRGFDSISYPRARTFTAGANVKF